MDAQSHEVRILIAGVADVEAFEVAVANWLDTQPVPHGGYTFSVWPLSDKD